MNCHTQLEIAFDIDILCDVTICFSTPTTRRSCSLIKAVTNKAESFIFEVDEALESCSTAWKQSTLSSHIFRIIVQHTNTGIPESIFESVIKDTFLQSSRCVEVVVCPEQRVPEERGCVFFGVFFLKILRLIPGIWIYFGDNYIWSQNLCIYTLY